MKRIFFCVVIPVAYLMLGCAKSGATDLTKDSEKENPQTTETGYGNGKIVVCGSNKVYIVNLKNSTQNKQDVEWEWVADKAIDIPSVYKFIISLYQR